MKREKIIKILQDIKIKTIIPVKLTWSLFFLFILIRIIEYFSFSFQYSSASFSDYFIGIRYDLLFAGIIGIIIMFLFQLLPRKTHKTTTIILVFLLLVLTLINWSLSEYYLTTLIPLDQSLLIYPLSDVYYIAASSANISFYEIFKILLIVIASLGIPYILIKKIKIALAINLLAFMPFLISLIFFNNITPDIRNYEQNRNFYQQINKASYLTKQLIKNYSGSIAYSDYDIPVIAEDYQKLRSDFDYLEPLFPFMRKNTDEDVIGKYFNFKEEEPNFVFIIVESLSRDFSGTGARMGSFTPFLDSLAEKSLYWKNFLVTSERTFNVLPSALASLPYADKGFMELIEKGPYPDFLSLNDILNQAGYHNKFFYGGWANFDYMEVFLEETGVDFILDENGFGVKYDKISSLEDGFTWGYPDHAVYQRSLEILDSLPDQPRFDIYLTLSMHDPFLPPSPEYWKKAFLKHLEKLNVEQNEKNFYKNRKEQFSTILYADNSIREFFNDYKEIAGFENTIFLIFGDHHMPMHDFTPIEKYHVPLIIYSPMLKTSKTFPAISSTADITPTLLSMMKNNYNINVPQWLHWLGCPLDTNMQYQNKKFIPFMRINRDINELLWKDYFFSEGRLFKVDEQMNLTPYSNDYKLSEIEKMLKYFNILNEYVCHSNTIYKPLKQHHHAEN